MVNNGQEEKGTDLNDIEKASQNHSEEEQGDTHLLIAGHVPDPFLSVLCAFLTQGILITTP